MSRGNDMRTIMFPGQGSQVKGMGSELFSKYSSMVQRANEILGYSIEELCTRDPEGKLHETQYTQPALYVVNGISYMNYLDSNNPIPQFLAGHSLGEFNAIQSGGAISFENGLRLVKKRGELMAKAPRGGMAAVIGASLQQIKDTLEINNLNGIDIANFNTYEQTILSGLREDISRAGEFFRAKNVRYIPLNTSGAFHSRYMKQAGQDFEKYLTTFDFMPMKIPVISNVTAKPHSNHDIRENLAKQLTSSVKWLPSIEYLLERDCHDFIECGHGQTLTKMMQNIKENYVALATPSSYHSTKIDRQQLKQMAHDQVRLWNQKYPVGTKVKAKNHHQNLNTRSEAIVLFGHRAAIYMDGFKGYFALDEIEPI